MANYLTRDAKVKFPVAGHDPGDTFAPQVTSQASRHLRWARTFASLVAFYKGRHELCPPDLIAGIHIANFERVARFWASADTFEDFVAQECGWSEPRWRTWQRWNDEFCYASRQRQNSLVSRFFSLRRSRIKDHFIDAVFKPSEDWKKLFDLGEHLAQAKVQEGGRTVPLLTSELMLLALASADDIAFAQVFRNSGVLISELEKAVMNGPTDPEKLRF